jgi:hypothetical protein
MPYSLPRHLMAFLVGTGVNDMLDRDGSRTPIQFHIANDYDKHPIDAQIVQAATKWKRTALKEFGMRIGEGLCTDMRAVRKDYFLARSQRLRRPMGLGTRDVLGRAQPRLSQGYRRQALEGAG